MSSVVSPVWACSVEPVEHDCQSERSTYVELPGLFLDNFVGPTSTGSQILDVLVQSLVIGVEVLLGRDTGVLAVLERAFLEEGLAGLSGFVVVHSCSTIHSEFEF